MSKSSKYTTAEPAAERERELEERRRQRELERQRREEEARQQRLEAERAALLRDADTARARAADAAGIAGAADLGARHTVLLDEIDRLAAAARSAIDDGQLATERDRLSAAQHETDEIALAAAGILAARERQGALAAIRAALASVPDHAEMDPSGAVAVDRLLSLADGRVADSDAFDAAHAELSSAVRTHLSQAQQRREALARMRAEAGQAQSALRELVDEARSADASLAGDAGAEEILAALAAAVDDEDVPRALSLAAQARQAAIRLEREFDGWLDQLDRAQLVFEAVTRALPRAGFTILADSYAVSGVNVTVRAERSDGSVVQLAVVPDEANGVEIAYHADGTDFVVEQTAHGEVARCDLTEEILERFHVELAAEDVVTGELRWEGKPATRPDAREAKKYWKPTSQSRQIR
jgi:hypothetical protein